MENKSNYYNLSLALAIFLILFLLIFSLEKGVSIWKEFYPIKAEKPNTITISAEGKVEAAPNVANVNLSVVSEGKKPADVQEENSKKMNAIIDFIKSLGIEAKDIKTSGYNLYPNYDYIKGQSILKSYTLNQSLNVKIRNTEFISQLLDGIVEKGVNQISDISFSIEDPEALKDEARKKAFENAKSKAESLAKIADVKLGKITTFSEGEVYLPRPYYYGVGGEGIMAKSAVAPTIETGSQEVRVSVNVTFEIK